MKEVQVYVRISGDYCAFHEMRFQIVYDITNNISLGYNEKTLEQLQNWEYVEYSDYELRNAILLEDGRYFVKW